MRWLIIWYCNDHKTHQQLTHVCDDFEGIVDDFKKYLEGLPSQTTRKRAQSKLPENQEVDYFPQCFNRVPNV
ncbi:MAG: hypothetical protein Q8P20_04915 [bacterium]|nr:hypothetical protein [bacterium]